ncbi:peptide chain release factor N(5)-glutamine methyltransferase [Aliagarivorans taiwanensis]|uniref:peptide chain release factor N(5)-glutamine methyltransferase n=1 Tax=Aliagarivorans taiwanensis TaxID=561966 RepID=UPI000554E9F6|nr:peptide chain release factor N(5)-glutamine methyltransferase [Aliagarivorans taiwanensis]
MTSKPSIAQAQAWARQQLQGGESPAVDARVLLQHVLDCEQSYLLTWPERELTPAQWHTFQQLIEQREQGHPVAHLTGLREFWSMLLEVNSTTLIPRPDTEVLVEETLKRVEDPADSSIVDLGTGTGAIALALASELPKATVYAGELQAQAVELATRNAKRQGLERVDIRQGSWLAPFAGLQFNVIVSNPPYIDAQDVHLGEGDVRFEPLTALVAEEHGLADIRAIIATAPDYLRPGGWLLFEHGYQQAQAVQSLLEKAGFVQCFTSQDYAGLDRVTGAQWWPKP